MTEQKQRKEADITEQQYRGASPIVAGLGESAIHGKFLLLTGIVAGTLAGAIFPTPIRKFVDKSYQGLESLYSSKNHLAHGVGGLGKWLLNIGKSTVDWLGEIGVIKTGLEKLQRNDRARRVATAIDGAIVTSGALSTLGVATGLFSGSRSSFRGKRQFETAKDEILTLRESNAQLREKLVETQFALEDYKTADAARQGILRVARDDTPSTQVSTLDAKHIAPAALTTDVALG